MRTTALVMMCSFAPLTLAACDQGSPATSDPVSTPRATSHDVPGQTLPSSGSPHGGAMSGGHAHGAGSAQPQMPPPPAAEQPSDPTVARFLGLEAPKPAVWIWHPPRNSMINTNYTVPGADGSKAAHLNVYFFGQGMGGPISDNIERWKNQFRSADGYEVEPIVDEFEVDTMPVTFVELEGEWMQMGAAWYTRDQLFLAAIIDAPAGRIFIRFAGDYATVNANREKFMEMIHGLRRVDDAGSSDAPAGEPSSGPSGY